MTAVFLRKDSRENKSVAWRGMVSGGDTQVVLLSCAHHQPRHTEMFCLGYLEISASASSDGLLMLLKALEAYLIKAMSALVPCCMTGRFIATSSRKASGEAEGLVA